MSYLYKTLRITRLSKIALIGLILIITSCKESLEKNLIDAIDVQCQNPKTDCKLSFKNVTEFKWERMYVFGSWTTSKEISNNLHIAYNGNDVPDNHTRLLFVNDKSVVYEEDEIQLDNFKSNIIFHELVDYMATAKIDYFTPTDAIFNVIKEKKKCQNCFLYSVEPLTKK